MSTAKRPDPLATLPTLDVAKLPTCFAGTSTADQAPMIATGQTLRTREEKHSFRTARNTRRAAEQIGRLPEPGEALHLLLKANAFDLFAILPAILDIIGQPADEVILSTLGINSRHIQALAELFQQKRIRRCSLLLSHYFSRVDKGEFAEAVELFRKHGFPVREARSHAKIIAVRFGTMAHYVCESSGNLRSCRAIESATIRNDRRLYRWHAAWIKEILEATP